MGLLWTGLRAVIEGWAGFRCEYCHAPQAVCGYRFHMEHIVPSIHGGSDDATNLALACATCNLAKGTKMIGIDPSTREQHPLFNPRINRWEEHFQWRTDRRTLEGKTPTARAT